MVPLKLLCPVGFFSTNFLFTKKKYITTMCKLNICFIWKKFWLLLLEPCASGLSYSHVFSPVLTGHRMIRHPKYTRCGLIFFFVSVIFSSSLWTHNWNIIWYSGCGSFMAGISLCCLILAFISLWKLFSDFYFLFFLIGQVSPETGFKSFVLAPKLIK